jgi:Uma2 family endonuclease
MPTQTAEYVDAIEHLPAGSTLVIPDVSWPDYERLLEELGEGYAPRVWYDEGRLEVVTPSGKHERAKDFILRLVQVIAEDLRIPLETAGSTTYKQKALRKGAEPDTCFYVQQVIGGALAQLTLR